LACQNPRFDCCTKFDGATLAVSKADSDAFTAYNCGLTAPLLLLLLPLLLLLLLQVSAGVCVWRPPGAALAG
jgi:hypothetical protein